MDSGRMLPSVPDDWTLEIKKKPIRHFYFRVLPDQKKILVSCPVTAGSKALDRAIQSRADWIHKQVHLARPRPRKPLPSCVSGETHFYKGIPHTLTVREDGDTPQVFLSENNTLVLCVNRGVGLEKRQALLEGWYRGRLQDAAGPMVVRWEPVVGVTVNQVRVRKMKTRWGSCNIQAARIWLNLELARLEPAYLEYVLVHEMAHLLERYHNRQFYGHMDRLIPHWPELKKALNRIRLP